MASEVTGVPLHLSGSRSAPLSADQRAALQVSAPAPALVSTKKSASVGTIVGATVGAVGGATIIAAVGIWYFKYHAAATTPVYPSDAATARALYPLCDQMSLRICLNSNNSCVTCKAAIGTRIVQVDGVTTQCCTDSYSRMQPFESHHDDYNGDERAAASASQDLAAENSGRLVVGSIAKLSRRWTSGHIRWCMAGKCSCMHHARPIQF